MQLFEVELNDLLCSMTKLTARGSDYDSGLVPGSGCSAASVGGGAPGAGGLAARSAALRPYVGQLAASEPEERLTEAACQPVAHTNGSCGERQGFHVRTSTAARWDGSIFASPIM